MNSQINNAINRYAELVKKTLPVDMIILYGSYARGTEHKDSDIDIAVVVRHRWRSFRCKRPPLFPLQRGKYWYRT